MIKYVLFFVVGLITSYGIMKLYNNLHDPKEVECLIQLESLGNRLEDFKKMCGNYPSEEEGIKALTESSAHTCAKSLLIGSVPLDPWDNEITYLLKNEKYYLLSSHSTCSYFPSSTR